MRFIKFRGKRTDNKEWIEGNFANIKARHFIVSMFDDVEKPKPIRVYADSVSQFTEYEDIKGKHLYEDDIVMFNDNPDDLGLICFGEYGVRDIETEEVIDNAVGWYAKVLKTDGLSELAPFCYDRTINPYWIKECKITVIGNKYDNPEYLNA